MSVDILRDSANTRSQHRRNLKGEGYIYPINFKLRQSGNQSNPRGVVRDRG
ncbi:hypothetical protein [Candidatus Regiella insecticola]|uniref:hypothetical protein n=1 Tax=Candidatus Regiella insecticola TaxID=138073 RepID=UPI0015969EF2|nr:hypothetical protein [Candidatus Regiella insecticola]